MYVKSTHHLESNRKIIWIYWTPDSNVVYSFIPKFKIIFEQANLLKIWWLIQHLQLCTSCHVFFFRANGLEGMLKKMARLSQDFKVLKKNWVRILILLRKLTCLSSSVRQVARISGLWHMQLCGEENKSSQTIVLIYTSHFVFLLIFH